MAPFSFAHAQQRNLSWKAYDVIRGRGFGLLHDLHGHHGGVLHRHHLPQGLPYKIKAFGATLRQVRRDSVLLFARGQDFSIFMYCKFYNSPTADSVNDVN